MMMMMMIGPKSRRERPETKIGAEVGHVTCDSDNTFKVPSRIEPRFAA